MLLISSNYNIVLGEFSLNAGHFLERAFFFLLDL